ncbi:hypothetical protein EON69_01395 [bacterium]|nr:MAG: hypothetical protein EON69_01395 [bacterium]
MPKEKEETNLHEDAIWNSAKRETRQGMEQNRKLFQDLMKSILAELLKEKKEEIGSFYRRGNYLIEGETSPINRSLILLIFIHPSLRDLRDSLSRTWPKILSLSL